MQLGVCGPATKVFLVSQSIVNKNHILLHSGGQSILSQTAFSHTKCLVKSWQNTSKTPATHSLNSHIFAHICRSFYPGGAHQVTNSGHSESRPSLPVATITHITNLLVRRDPTAEEPAKSQPTKNQPTKNQPTKRESQPEERANPAREVMELHFATWLREKAPLFTLLVTILTDSKLKVHIRHKDRRLRLSALADTPPLVKFHYKEKSTRVNCSHQYCARNFQ